MRSGKASGALQKILPEKRTYLHLKKLLIPPVSIIIMCTCLLLMPAACIPNSPDITTLSLPTGQIGVWYLSTIQAKGGTPPYKATIYSGTLPPGLTIDNTTIKGIPTASGSYNFVVRLIDSRGASDLQNMTLFILEAARPPGPVINSFTANPTTIPSGRISTLSWEVSGASSVMLDDQPSDRKPFSVPVSMPTFVNPIGQKAVYQTKSHTYTLTACDKNNNCVSQTIQVAVSGSGPVGPIAGGLPVISSFAANPAYIVTGQAATLSWTVSGASRVTIDNGIGDVTTVKQKIVYPATNTTYTLTAYNSYGQVTRTAQVTISGTPGLTITTNSLPAGKRGTSYSQTLQATGGSTPYTWSLASGTLPPNLTLLPAGIIIGNPIADVTSTFMVKVTDSKGATATKLLSIAITISIAFQPDDPILDATVGENYTYNFQSLTNPSGGHPPYTFFNGFGFPPMGLTLAPNGILSGKPAAAGTTEFEVCVKDLDGNQKCGVTHITVNPANKPAQGDWKVTFELTSVEQDGGYTSHYYESGELVFSVRDNNEIEGSGTAEGRYDDYQVFQYNDGSTNTIKGSGSYDTEFSVGGYYRYEPSSVRETSIDLGDFSPRTFDVVHRHSGRDGNYSEVSQQNIAYLNHLSIHLENGWQITDEHSSGPHREDTLVIHVSKVMR